MTAQQATVRANHHIAFVVTDTDYPGDLALTIEHRDPQVVNGQFLSAPITEEVVAGTYDADSADAVLASRGLVRSEPWEIVGAGLIAEVVPAAEVLAR